MGGPTFRSIPATQNLEFNFNGNINPVETFFAEQPKLLRNRTNRREILEAETQLFGFAVSGHPLEMFPDTMEHLLPGRRIGKHIRETVGDLRFTVVEHSGRIIRSRRTDEISDARRLDSGMVETELFAQTYKSYGLATVRYPVLEATATVGHSKMGAELACGFYGETKESRTTG